MAAKPQQQPWVNWHMGTVVSVKRWSDTHVSSSGGGGSVAPKYGGYVAAPKVHSEVVQRQEVFLRNHDGKEMAFELGGTNVAAREGSTLLVAWGGFEEKEPPIYVENLDTGETYSRKLQEPERPGVGAFIVILVISGLISWLLAFPISMIINSALGLWGDAKVTVYILVFFVLTIAILSKRYTKLFRTYEENKPRHAKLMKLVEDALSEAHEATKAFKANLQPAETN